MGCRSTVTILDCLTGGLPHATLQLHEVVHHWIGAFHELVEVAPGGQLEFGLTFVRLWSVESPIPWGRHPAAEVHAALERLAGRWLKDGDLDEEREENIVKQDSLLLALSNVEEALRAGGAHCQQHQISVEVWSFRPHEVLQLLEHSTALANSHVEVTLVDLSQRGIVEPKGCMWATVTSVAPTDAEVRRHLRTSFRRDVLVELKVPRLDGSDWDPGRQVLLDSVLTTNQLCVGTCSSILPLVDEAVTSMELIFQGFYPTASVLPQHLYGTPLVLRPVGAVGKSALAKRLEEHGHAGVEQLVGGFLGMITRMEEGERVAVFSSKVCPITLATGNGDATFRYVAHLAQKTSSHDLDDVPRLVLQGLQSEERASAVALELGCLPRKETKRKAVRASIKGPVASVDLQALFNPLAQRSRPALVEMRNLLRQEEPQRRGRVRREAPEGRGRGRSGRGRGQRGLEIIPTPMGRSAIPQPATPWPSLDAASGAAASQQWPMAAPHWQRNEAAARAAMPGPDWPMAGAAAEATRLDWSSQAEATLIQDERTSDWCMTGGEMSAATARVSWGAASSAMAVDGAAPRGAQSGTSYSMREEPPAAGLVQVTTNPDGTLGTRPDDAMPPDGVGCEEAAPQMFPPQPGTPVSMCWQLQPGAPVMYGWPSQPATPWAPVQQLLAPGQPVAQPAPSTPFDLGAALAASLGGAQPGTFAAPGTPLFQAWQPGQPAWRPGTPARLPGTPARQPGTPARLPGTPAHAPGTPRVPQGQGAAGQPRTPFGQAWPAAAPWKGVEMEPRAAPTASTSEQGGLASLLGFLQVPEKKPKAKASTTPSAAGASSKSSSKPPQVTVWEAAKIASNLFKFKF